jgi:hypothetical protein
VSIAATPPATNIAPAHAPTARSSEFAAVAPGATPSDCSTKKPPIKAAIAPQSSVDVFELCKGGSRVTAARMRVRS